MSDKTRITVFVLLFAFSLSLFFFYYYNSIKFYILPIFIVFLFIVAFNIGLKLNKESLATVSLLATIFFFFLQNLDEIKDRLRVFDAVEIYNCRQANMLSKSVKVGSPILRTGAYEIDIYLQNMDYIRKKYPGQKLDDFITLLVYFKGTNQLIEEQRIVLTNFLQTPIENENQRSTYVQRYFLYENGLKNITASTTDYMGKLGMKCNK